MKKEWLQKFSIKVLESASFSLISMLFDSAEKGHNFSDNTIYHYRETNNFVRKNLIFDLLEIKKTSTNGWNRSILLTLKFFIFVNV